ncbi:MAG: hypothetical protein JO189_04395 [Deltaproteobacteria bacterium]|nr:hypothetical protein [Deltaproteobacteria bacterium]
MEVFGDNEEAVSIGGPFSQLSLSAVRVAGHTHRLKSSALRRGMQLHAYEALEVIATGEQIVTQSEPEVFERLGMSYRKPAERVGRLFSWTTPLCRDRFRQSGSIDNLAKQYPEADEIQG